MCRLSFGLVTVLVASFAVGLSFATKDKDGAANAETEDKRRIVKVTVDGTDYVVPVQSEIRVTEARRAIDVKAIEIIVAASRKMVTIVFLDEKKPFMWTLKGKMERAMKPMEDVTKELADLKEAGDDSEELEDGYVKKMQTLVKDVFKAKSKENLGDQEIVERTENLFRALQLLAETSPTGLYLDWAALKIGNAKQSLAQYVAPVFSGLTRHYTVAGNLLSFFPGFFSKFLVSIDKKPKGNSNPSKLPPGDGVKS